ncbi:lipopolysaccharide biosynthesis protein [Azospirillum brasilense]|nr:hypothetical protein [Azospirillum brasilense]
MRMIPASLPASLVRSFWTLADQGVVSLGMFAINIQLARTFPSEEYGTFVFFLSVLLALQVVNVSLIQYPLSVEGAVLDRAERRTLAGRAVLMTAGSILPLSGIVALVGYGLGMPELVGPAVLYFIVWQVQEIGRRGLMSGLKHDKALWGDSVTYLGQIAVLNLMALGGHLTLERVFIAMTGPALAGAVVHFAILRPRFDGLSDLPAVVRRFWSIGHWALANNLFLMLRVQSLVWLMAAMDGMASTAAFQAVVNLVNIANPIIIGMGNLVPQIAARGRSTLHTEAGGLHPDEQAWLAIRGYVVIGAAPLLVYYSLGLLFPDQMLHIVYGAMSPYADQEWPLRLLSIGALAGYLAEMVCSYFYGVQRSQFALVVNVTGTLAVFAVVGPLAAMYGVAGVCMALLFSSLLRVGAAHHYLSKTRTAHVAR